MKHIILIPVYDDWKSLNKLLLKLKKNLKNERKIDNEILIVNDNSNQKPDINSKRLKIFKKIKILSLNKNFGSQIAIAVGLNYLKSQKGNFYITVMDGDGEDSPKEIKTMLKRAMKFKDYVITSNRKKRKESLLIIYLYKLHLLITFLFTFKWISFGNFSTFNKKNLKKILLNNYALYAHSSAVLKNCKIKRLYAKREKRFYDKSKLGIFSLLDHSFRVNSVFYKNIILSSILYSLIIISIFDQYYGNLFLFLILSFNLIILFTKIKYWNYNIDYFNSNIINIKLFKTG